MQESTYFLEIGGYQSLCRISMPGQFFSSCDIQQDKKQCTAVTIIEGISGSNVGERSHAEVEKYIQQLQHGLTALLVQDGVEQEIPAGIWLAYRAVTKLFPLAQNTQSPMLCLTARLSPYMDCLDSRKNKQANQGDIDYNSSRALQSVSQVSYPFN